MSTHFSDVGVNSIKQRIVFSMFVCFLSFPPKQKIRTHHTLLFSHQWSRCLPQSVVEMPPHGCGRDVCPLTISDRDASSPLSRDASPNMWSRCLPQCVVEMPPPQCGWVASPHSWYKMPLTECDRDADIISMPPEGVIHLPPCYLYLFISFYWLILRQYNWVLTVWLFTTVIHKQDTQIFVPN